jgi:hypothetical protein
MTYTFPIYRFLDSDAAVKTIEAGAFRVGRLSNFNDPFEWQVGGTGTTMEEQEHLDHIRSTHIPYLETWMGVLCFSASVSTPVLWSLYAEKHRGVAFEIKNSWPSDHLHKMTYSNDRPLLDFGQLKKLRVGHDRDNYFLSLLDRLMKQKSMGWSFEDEYRIFIDLNNAKYCRATGAWHDWLISKTVLTRVILGFRCVLDESTVRRLLDHMGFIDTQVVRAKMCSETYTIVT